MSLGKKLSERDPDAGIKSQTALNLRGLGDCYAAMGQFEDAVSCYDDSLEIYTWLVSSGHFSEIEMVGVYNNMASTMHDAELYDQALKYYQQEMACFQGLLESGALSDDTLLMDLALCYANQGLVLLNLGDNRQALDILEKASEIFSSAPSGPETDYYQATVLSSMGRAWQNMGDYQKARTYLARSVSILEQYAGDTGNHQVMRALADNYRYMGISEKSMAQAEKAMVWYSKAIELYDLLADSQDDPSLLWKLATALHELGAVYMDAGDYDTARPLFSRAKDAFASHGGSTGSAYARDNVAICDNNIGLSFYNQGDYDSAIPYLSDAAGYYWSKPEDSGPNWKRIYADCCGFLGRCYAFLGEYEKAKGWHQESALVFEALSKEQPGYLHSYALSLYWAAMDRVLLGDSQAENYYILCLDRYDKCLENGDKSLMPNYLALYAFYYLVFDNDYGQALEISRQAWQANPEDVYVKKVYAHSLLFSGYVEESLAILSGLVAGIPTDISFVRLDLEVFRTVGYSGSQLDPISRLFDK